MNFSDPLFPIEAYSVKTVVIEYIQLTFCIFQDSHNLSKLCGYINLRITNNPC
jgi:hypothetical protein